MNTDLQDWTANLQSTSWFFGVGIDDYLEFPTLHNAVKDVEDIKHLLLGKYDFEPDHVHTLYNQEATEDNIKGKLEALTRKLGPHDKLLIYYSGHGHLSKTNRGYWISHDAKRGNPSRYISNADIRTYLEDSPAKHILLISDSCFSGALFHTGRMRSSRSVTELEKYASRWGLCSGRHDEEVWDGEPGQNSPFARSILEALETNEMDGWNVSKLVEVVTEQTAAHTRQLPQGSPLAIHGHKGGQYVFRLKGSKPDLTSTTAAERVPQSSFTSQISDVAKRSKAVAARHAKRVGRTLVWIFAAIGLLITGLFIVPDIFGSGKAAPVQLQYEMFADAVQFNFIGGKPTYTLSLTNEEEQYYGGELEETGLFTLNFEQFFAYPGDYDLTITDGSGLSAQRTVTIPSPEDIAINAFHTATGMNSETLWPLDQAQQHSIGQPVYLYASVFSALPQEVVIKWYDEESNLLFAPEIRVVDTAMVDPFRIVTYQQLKEPGGYLVQLVNYNGIIVGETVFAVEAPD